MATKLEVSDYGKRINQRIDDERIRRGLSVRAFARLIGRSEKYVRDRLSEESEWALSDINRIADAWGIPTDWLTSQDTSSDNTSPLEQLTDDQLVQIMLAKLNNGDVSLVANRDPHKYEEMEGGDGR